MLALIAVGGSARAQRHLHLPLPRWKQPRSSHDRAGGQCSSGLRAWREQDRTRLAPRAKRDARHLHDDCRWHGLTQFAASPIHDEFQTWGS